MTCGNPTPPGSVRGSPPQQSPQMPVARQVNVESSQNLPTRELDQRGDWLRKSTKRIGRIGTRRGIGRSHPENTAIVSFTLAARPLPHLRCPQIHFLKINNIQCCCSRDIKLLGL